MGLHILYESDVNANFEKKKTVNPRFILTRNLYVF